MTKLKDNVFKTLPKVGESEYAYAVMDGFPVTEGHTLVVPKRDGATLENLSDTEIISCIRLVVKLAKESGADGYNVGVNQGLASGQTIGQLHFHMIPRRWGM